MAFHDPLRTTGYELAAINSKTGQQFFICHVRSGRSRRALSATLGDKVGDNKETRLDLVCAKTGCRADRWEWAKKASDGLTQGDWQIRFTNRTGKDLDSQGTGPTIYDEAAV